MVSLKAGAPFHTFDLRAAIKRLFETGRYSDIRATGRPQGGGVALTFRTREQWFVGRVDARGVEKNPAKGEAAEIARLDLGQPLYDDDLDAATRRVQDLLLRNGLYEARVETSVRRDPEFEIANIRFLIDAGKRARFARPIITGSPGMDPDKIAGAFKWKRWLLGPKKVTEERVQRGVQNVRKKFSEKNRLAARVTLEGMDYDAATRRATPRLNVVAGPKVELHTEGSKLSGKLLKRYVPVYQENAVDRDLLVEGARNLRDYFQMKGYFDVKVDFKQETPAPDHYDIVYDIDLGKRQKLVHIEVQGNRYFDTPAIEERLMLREAGWLRLRHGRYSEAAVGRDEDSIQALYQANGFRDVKVTTRTLDDYQGKAGEMAVVITIDEGPQYLVSKFDADGFRQLPAQQFLPSLASMVGQPFSENSVALDRNFILRTYQNEGFPDARFTWDMRPGSGPNQVEVRYHVVEGDRREVRNVVIAGTDVTRMRLIRPAMRLAPGEPISPRKMFAAQRDLYELGIFEKVDTAVQNPEGLVEKKNVLYQLTEGHKYYLAGGFGAEVARIGGSQNSFESPGGATGFSPRVNLDVSRLNLWGLGHSLNFKSRFSTLQKRALLNYSAPRYRNVEGRNFSFTGLYDDSRDVRTFAAKRLEGSAQYSLQFGKTVTTLFRYTFRRSSVDPNTLKISPLLIPLASQPVRIGMISSSFIHDRRDSPIDTHKGIYTTVDTGLAAGWFASRRNFARLLVRNASYHPFGRAREYVLARNLQFGWLGPFRTGNLDPIQAIPLPERFFGGGSTSHRGFPDNQAGPRDAETGFPLGGNVLLFHNTEFRFPLLGDNIDGVLFHDMGNVYSRPGRLSFRVHQRDFKDFDYMVHAAGFGIRYRTPVGPVRVDLAYSMNPPQFFGFKGTRQEVILGTAPRQLQRVSRFQFFFSIGQAF